MHSKNTKKAKCVCGIKLYKDALYLIKANTVQKAFPPALKVMHSFSGRYVICMFLKDTYRILAFDMGTLG